MLRPATMASLFAAIEQTKVLKPNDFVVTNQQGELGGTRVKFVYRYDESYFFEYFVEQDRLERLICQGRQSPGEMTREEASKYEGLTEFLQGFKNWAYRLADEITSMPLYRAIMEQEEQLREYAARLDELPNEPFPRDEIDELRRKLEGFEAAVVAGLKAEEEQNESIYRRISTLEDDVKFLKGQLDIMTQKNWWSAFVVRLNGWRKEPGNQAMLEMAKDGALALGPGAIDKLKDAV